MFYAVGRLVTGLSFALWVPTSAFSHHFIPVDLLTQDQMGAVLREKHTKEEWAQLFTAWKSQAAQTLEMADDHKVLMSAIKLSKRAKADPFGTSYERGRNQDLTPLSSSSEDDLELVILPSEDSSDKTPEERLSLLLMQWGSLVGSMSKVSEVVRRLKRTHEFDMEAMEDRINTVDALVGRCEKEPMKEDCISAWDGITLLHTTVESLTKSFNTLEQTVVALGAEVQGKIQTNEIALKNAVDDMAKGLQDLASFVTALNDEQILIGQRLASVNPGLAVSSLNVERDLRELKARISAIEDNTPSHQGFTFQPPPVNSREEIAGIQIQLKLLESRIPVHNLLKLGGSVFQSRADVAVFVETKMPSNSFSMFHDIITLMERLTGNYVERKDVISEWYQATKVGLDEREARHVASFKITYPTVFGYVKEGAAASKYHLPAVKTFKDWNSFDSESGVKSFILNGMGDLKLQLNQDISSFFELDQFYDAKVLAHDMHSKSQIFIAEMCNWMDVFYQELLTTSEATEEEAWELVSACIKKIFEELRRVRASAANATSEVNAANKCATYLWALIQSHRVMKKFLDMRFRNHPSIAPVIILHVFKTRVTRVSHTNQVKRLEGQIAKLESTPAFRNPKGSQKDPEGDKDKKGGKN